MDDLVTLRKQLDEIDDELFSLLERRFTLSEKVKLVKGEHHINISDPSRENTIIDRIPQSSHNNEIQELYQLIFHLSKAIQKKVG
jgi:chorismate mutase